AAAEELRADLLVVGASRRGAAWKGILGSTAWQVLARSTLPVLVVHRPFGAAVRRVLLAADLGAGRNALGHAVDVVEALFGRDHPELRCLHVVEQDPLLPAHPAAALERAGRQRLVRFLDDPRLARSIEGSVRVGDPARETAWEAAEWGADLVVVPTFGRSGEGYGPLGRLGFATARGAPCNVLALPVPGGTAYGRTSPAPADTRAEPLVAAGLSAA
ncbi:MAG TPA: universal stress protein, partial [Longimicrobiaceae bacterium]|nr:universal stress protein [Longimicrobiaceae bacterium]